MNKITKFLITTCAIFMFNQFVFASDFKLGYIDTTKIFTSSEPSKKLRDKLKAKFTPQEQELKKINDALAKLQDQLQSLVKSEADINKLSKTDKAKFDKLSAEYQKTQANFQQKYYIFQQNLQMYQTFATNLVVEKINTILKDISEKNNYDLVLTSSQVIYVKSKYDLTDETIEKLNKINMKDLEEQFDKAEQTMKAQSTVPNIQSK